MSSATANAQSATAEGNRPYTLPNRSGFAHPALHPQGEGGIPLMKKST